jgi:hypothetical protein
MKRFITLVLVLLLLLFAGCSNSDTVTDTPDPEAPATAAPPSAVPTLSPTPTPEPTPLPYLNGLNGERSEKDFGNTRPFAVMINNIVYAMPQCGVSQADIIYEALAEGGVTRMMAIFSDLTESEAKTIGSMRSIRPYFIEIGLAYDAIIVHAGGSEQAYSDIKTKDADNIDGVRGPGASAFYRDPNRQAYGIEHSLFTTPENILEQVAALEYETEHSTADFDYGLRFVEEAADAIPASGKAASSIDVDFGGQKMTYLAYDSAAGVYTAVQHNQDYIDGDTGSAVKFDNVLILYADTKVLDNYGRRSIDLDGTGEGHYACGGKYVDITWSHGSTGTQFSYTLADGSELELAPGHSYIAIVPTGSDILFG